MLMRGKSWEGLENEEGKGERIWLKSFLYMYEYGTLKTAEVILRRAGGRGRIMEVTNQTGLQYMYILECYDTPCITTIY
jgi:hypothetical protein